VWIVAVSAWNFTDTWVLLGLAGIAATIATGAGFLGAGVRAAGEARGRARSFRPRDPATDQAHLRGVAGRSGRPDPGRRGYGLQARQLSRRVTRGHISTGTGSVWSAAAAA
jgi:hypothetical protein